MRVSLLILMAGIVFVSCTSKTETAEDTGKLPDTRPLDLVLKMREDGGMMNHQTNLYISADSSFFKVSDHNIDSITFFKLTDVQMDSLYLVLKTNQFDEIKYLMDTAVLDRGGLSVDVFWNNNQNIISVDDSGQAFVDERWHKQWGAVLQYLDQYIDKR
ncbi:MAG: hypothetical protein HOP08_15540 [Cyclobacteriaceae bacterium]|nr:hypothetical protein [Cyclobacteriaceae bacterium]